MFKVPSIPLRKEPTFDIKAWQETKEKFIENYFTAYLIYESNDGNLTIVKDRIEKVHKEDNFTTFIRSKDLSLIYLIDHKSCEVIWSAPDCPKNVGDIISDVHQMWTVFNEQPRYFLVGNVKHDNFNGGYPCK